jgi:outer membrane protein assembly factor BamB
MVTAGRTGGVGLLVFAVFVGASGAFGAEDWPQLQYDSRHSGNVPDRAVATPLGLVGAAPLTDAIFTAPAVAGGRVYVVDGSGAAFCLDAASLRVLWKFASRGGAGNCNNVSSPAVVGRYVHFGTMAGSYYVLDAAGGKPVKEIRCGEPIFSAPVVSGDRVYFATLGSRVYAITPEGGVCWTWDYVKEVLGFGGERWSGADWREHKIDQRVRRSDMFCCSRDLAAFGKTVVVPAGGSVVWLDDAGTSAKVRALHQPHTVTFGLSIGQDGAVYRQWHWLDNHGSVEILRLRDGKVEVGQVPGTRTHAGGAESVSFSLVSLRGGDVYRCRPEEGFGLCKHAAAGAAEPQSLGGYPSICPPVLLRDSAVCGGLDGRLYVVPLAGGKAWSFGTAFARAISAPPAVCDGRVYFGCEDGYLYALGPGGSAPLPSDDLQLARIRSPLTGQRTDPKHDWFTSFGNWANTNANEQGIQPPFRIRWVRRFPGTAKQFSTCGGGRMYTHTAEGIVFAVEQETGRLLWRRYWPGVHISYTTPLYYRERLFVPQAGLERCRLRCLDAATGKLLWEAPFAGSPSWNRQQPPIICKGLAIYMFSTGKYAPGRVGERPGWLFGHQDVRSFPEDHKPIVRAWDIETGKEAWTRDFSDLGCGGDEAGLCLMDGKLYYSSFFGYAATRRGEPGPRGVTACLDPATGRVLWSTTKYSVHGGCTVSAADGRLYLGGYNRADDKTGGRYVWCLDARDGSLIWRSDPVRTAIHVVTIGRKFLFAHAQNIESYLIDKDTGKIVRTLRYGYQCTRFTLSEPYLLGCSMDVHDLRRESTHLSTGPRLDPSECIAAIASNGRLFYTGQGGGMQACQVCGPEAASLTAPWAAPAPPKAQESR